MNLSTDRRTLADALGLLGGLAGKKFPMNCLHAVATRGELADELELTAMDGLAILAVELEAEVQAEGRVICPLSALLALVQAETGPSLTLKEDRGHLKVAGASVRGSVATAEVEAYPTLFRPPEEGWTDITRAPLWEAIERAMGLAGSEPGVSVQGLDGVLLRASGEVAEVLSWHGWRATLESVPIDVAGVDFQAVITHANWKMLREFDHPTVQLLRTATHHLWRQPGTILMCRRGEKEDRWPTTDNAGLVLLRQSVEDGLTLAWGQASSLLGTEKALAQCAGVPMTVEWNGRELALSRENDVNSATVKEAVNAGTEPWTFRTKDIEGIFGLLNIAVKSKQPATLSPWKHGLRVAVGKLTGFLAPY